MTDEDTRGFQSLCQEAARIAASGGDVEDVAQELFLWILETPSIRTPSYRGLKNLLVKQARKIVANDRAQSSPYGWTGGAWTTAEIRSALRSDYHNLPPALSGALASERMPHAYRAALDAVYGRGERLPKGSSLRRQAYRAVDRLQKLVNFPATGGAGRLDVATLTDVQDAALTAAADREIEQRRVEEARGALLDRVMLVGG